MPSKTIGVLVIDIEGAYSRMIWQEAARRTQSAGFDLLVLPANNPKCPYNFRSQFNSLYNFINPSVIDALIFVPSIIGNFFQPEETQHLLFNIMNAVPVVSLNTLIPGVPSLLIDNTKGIEAAVSHFTSVHGYRRIGFLEGPPDNNESIERKSAFLAALLKAGISPEPDWFMPCDFTEESAARLGDAEGRAVALNLDAVIAANDTMAVGFLKSLERQGIRVPDDLAVIGFDDIKEAPCLRIPLTTIRQPFVKLAQKAADLAIDLCEGRPVNQVQQFGTELVVRASCGCSHYIRDDILRSQCKDVTAGREAVLRRFLLDRFALLVCERLFEPLDALMVFLLTKEADTDSKRLFLKHLEAMLDTEFFQFDSTPNWSAIFSFITDFVQKTAADKAQRWQKINLFERALCLINQKQKLWTGYMEFRRHDTHTIPMRQAAESMSLVRDHFELAAALESTLPLLSVQNCFLSLLKDGENSPGLFSSLPKQSEAILAYRNGKSDPEVSPKTPLVFSTLDLWPKAKSREQGGNVWAVGPLFNREHLFGFIVSGISDFDSWTNESLRHQISIALYSCFLNAEREKAESRLRTILSELEQNNRQLEQESSLDEMTGLLNRRGFIKHAGDLLNHCKNGEARFAVFFADMDGLKQINDTLGHAEGDRAIIDMSVIFKQVFRSEDVIARFGGDEFTAFMLNVPWDFKATIEKRAAGLLSQFNRVEKRAYTLSFSLGSVMGTVDENPELDDILKMADKVLYQQKREKMKSDSLPGQLSEM
jgi:diguanylate cyclase (GGDEF)-like protein